MPPLLGEHTEEVLLETGFSAEKIAALREARDRALGVRSMRSARLAVSG